MKKAFTLAEVMITLTIIGIITAVIIPVAIQSKPNENIMKFKKAHNTLYQVISTLINSDEYYLNGDLKTKANGELLDGSHEDDYMYFCNSLTQVLTIRSENCAKRFNSGHNTHQMLFTKTVPDTFDIELDLQVTKSMVDKFKKIIDIECKSDVGLQLKNQIILTDGAEIYEMSNLYPFGKKYWGTEKFLYGSGYDSYMYDINGFGVGYKPICIDIDGTPDGEINIDKLDLSQDSNWWYSSKPCDDVKDICPFGYAIRADGKIITGARADSWLAKSIQGD